MAEYQLEYLQMKEKYLSLKNEMGLYDDLEGQGIMGRMRRGVKSAVGNKASSSISVAIDFYKKIFKTQKVTPDTKKGTAKIHNDLKIKYFDARRDIEAFESFIENFPKPDPDTPDKDLAPCFSPKNKMKFFKKKYPIHSYQIVFIYPYERAVAKAIEAGKKTSEVSRKASELISAYGILSGYQKGANVTKFEKFAAEAIQNGPLSHQDENFYIWQALKEASDDVGVEFYSTEQQFTDSERAAYEGRLASKEAKKGRTGRSGLGISLRNPIKVTRKSRGGDFDSSDDYGYDYDYSSDSSVGGYSEGDEDYYIY